MTKKHVKLIAEILKEHKEQLDFLANHDKPQDVYDRVYKQLVDGMAEVCGQINPNFRYSTLKEACNAN